MAKNKTINNMMILSEKFFLFMLTTLPKPNISGAFPMPGGKRLVDKAHAADRDYFLSIILINYIPKAAGK
jgi:hypothetical protein